MAQDKQLNRIEAKLDALLQKNKIDPAEFGGVVGKTPSVPAVLTAEQKQAIANAPLHRPARDGNGKPIGEFGQSHDEQKPSSPVASVEPAVNWAS